MRRRWVVLAASLATSILGAYALLAGNVDLEDPVTVVSELLSPTSASRIDPARFTATAGAFIDWEAICVATLGAAWDERSWLERWRFRSLLRTLVSAQLGHTPDYLDGLEARLSSKDVSADRAVLHIVAQMRARPGETPVLIDIVVGRVGRDWHLTDVVTDDVSLVRNYQRQFARLLAREGWDGLLARMQRRADELRVASAE